MPDIPLGTALAVFAAAFGAWAWVVAWGVSTIRAEVHAIKSQVGKLGEQAHAQMMEVEHRLTLVEADIRRCAVFSNHDRGIHD